MSNISQSSHQKGISKSRTRPSWPSANVKLTHFIFSHLLFTAHISALVQGHCLRHRRVMCVEGDRVHLGWELRCLGAGEVNKAWPQRCQRSSRVRRTEARWEVPLNIYMCAVHAKGCVWVINPACKIWHTCIPSLCIRWGTRKPHTFLPEAPQMLLHGLMAPVTVWWIGPGGLSCCSLPSPTCFSHGDTHYHS